MAILLNRAYQDYPAGQIVELTLEVEAALVAQGLAATATIANVTTGAVTTNALSGTVAFAAGAASLVITNSKIVANTKMHAVVAQAAADGTLLRIERIVCAAGSATLFGTAAATATTLVDWAIINPPGMTVANT